MVKTKYKHFNPEDYNIKVKTATVRTSFHVKYNINYHIIWIPKYRKAILKGKVSEVLKQIIDGQCKSYGWKNLALEVMPDHIHFFVSAKPNWKPSQIVNILKGNTARQLRLLFPELKYLGYKNHYGKGFKSLWADGYYISSAGHVSEKQVIRYIQEQEGQKPFNYDIFSPTKPKEIKQDVGLKDIQKGLGDFS